MNSLIFISPSLAIGFQLIISGKLCAVRVRKSQLLPSWQEIPENSDELVIRSTGRIFHAFR